MRITSLPNIAVFFLLNLLCFAVFFSTISRPFQSDDYEVLYRVALQKQLLIPGFFRPVSDITIYFCYLVGGLNAKVFNVFNLLVHAASAFVLYRFCLVSNLFSDNKKQLIAWASSVLFLIYPFHAESVLWMVGRASSISCFFGFLSLLVAFTGLSTGWRYFLVCLFYFIGLASYETIFPLPLILLILLYQPGKRLQTSLPLTAWLTVTVIIHLLLRTWLAQTLAGQYGQKVFSFEMARYAVNFFKVTGRLLLPPSAHSTLLSGVFVVVLILLALLSFFLLKKRAAAQLTYIKLLGIIMMSSVIPSMFGVSTHTSEGDRLLYFTSYFFVLWLSFILSLFVSKKTRYVSLAFLGLYFFYFLVQSNRDWVSAGKTTRDVLSSVSEKRQQYRSFGLINLPEEKNGAFIFRVGFKQALLINKIDTAGITVLRTITSEETIEMGQNIGPRRSVSSLFVPPNTFINNDSILVARPVFFDTVMYSRNNFQQLFYWNKTDFRPLF